MNLLNPANQHVIIVIAFLLILASVAIPKWQQSAKRKKLALSGIHEIDQMPGRVFEEYLAAVFRQKGYKVELTKASSDQGGDLVISKHGVRTVVQAKRWKENVGNHAVQEVVAAKPYYKAERAVIVTNSGFTKSAVELASANGVELWDRQKLVRELVSTKARQNVFATSLKGTEYEQPIHSPKSAKIKFPTLPKVLVASKICPQCGRKMVVRHRHRDGAAFWGCEGYPKCKYIKKM